MISWGARLLYAGPAIQLSWHANGVGEFSLALDGDIELQRDGAPDIVARSVFVPAGSRHQMNFRCSRVACFYVDVAASDGDRLRGNMDDFGGAYAANHRAEDEISARAAALLADAIPPDERRQSLGDVLGLEPASGVDSRIGLALRMIHDAPDSPHRVRNLAAVVNLSETQFRKAFSAATGVPLKRYRVWARLTAAMKAARSGASLTAAAHGAGFSSSAHFSVAYRNMFGMTPSAFLDVLAQAGPPTGGDPSSEA